MAKVIYIQLFRDGEQMLGSDGVMKVTGSEIKTTASNVKRIANQVRERNKMFELNMPYKVATSFALYNNGIGSTLSVQYDLFNMFSRHLVFADLAQLKEGSVIYHYCSGLKVYGTVVKIYGRQVHTTHKPVQWGKDTYTESMIFVKDEGSSPLAYIN